MYFLQKLQQKYSEFSIEQYKKMIKEIAKKCGNSTIKSVNKFIKNVDENIWVDANDAIKLGIVDGLWTHKLENNIKYNK